MTKAAPLVDIDARMLGIVRTLGYVPAIFAAMLSERALDMFSHHRRSVLKNHEFDAGDRATRMIASRIAFYGSRRRDSFDLKDSGGESFLSSNDAIGAGDPTIPSLDAKSIRAWEFGASLNTRKVMAIPIGRGRPFSGVFSTVPIWRKTKARTLDLREFDIVPGKGGGPNLIVDRRARSIKRASRQGFNGDLVVGILARRRTQPKKLGWREQFERIRPKHERKLDQLAEQVVTKAGRAALKDEKASIVDDRAAYVRAFRESISENPGQFAAARRAAKAAKRGARSNREGGS